MRATFVALGAMLTLGGCGSSLTAPTVKGQPPEYVEPAMSASSASAADKPSTPPAVPPVAEPAPPSTPASVPSTPAPDGGAH